MKLGSPAECGLEESKWWIREDPDLRDAWIEYLRERPDVLAEVRANWTGGPSAVSYYRGSTPTASITSLSLRSSRSTASRITLSRTSIVLEATMPS
jgi:hypothetical protein